MHKSKRSRVYDPNHPDIALYKSAQFKQPASLKKRHVYTVNSSNVNSYTSSFLNAKDAESRLLKSVQFGIGDGFGSSREMKSSKTKKKMITEAAREIRGIGNQFEYSSGRYKMDDLLGLKNSKVEKNSDKESKNKSHKQSCQNYQNNNHIDQVHVQSLKDQNQNLMRTNELLLYEKQFFRQKIIFQEIQIRDLQRKLKDKGHKKVLTRESDFTFKVHQEQRINESETNNTNHYQIGTSKSSLLISQSEQQRPALADKSSFQNMYFGNDNKKSIEKAENEFAELLQTVQSENNQHRKMTLRKMLALKAVELKKIKQRH